MQIRLEKSVVLDLRKLGVLADIVSEIVRKGVAGAVDEEPDGDADHCRCSYRVGKVTVIGTWRMKEATLVLDRVSVDAVQDEERDLLDLDEVRKLVAGVHPLRVWREHRGLTTKALAALAGVGQTSISNIETREIGMSPKKRDALAAALRVDPLDITEISGPATQEPLSGTTG